MVQSLVQSRAAPLTWRVPRTAQGWTRSTRLRSQPAVTDNGAPGLRDFVPNYAAYVRDPDGNNVEAVCRTA